MPGQYTVGRRFDVAADALVSITTWDLSRTGASEKASMYPIYLALGLSPAATQVSETYGPLAFVAIDSSYTTPYTNLNVSQYMVVDAPPFKPYAL